MGDHSLFFKSPLLTTFKSSLCQTHFKPLVRLHFSRNALAHAALVADGISQKLALCLELREDLGHVARAVALRNVDATLAVANADHSLLWLAVILHEGGTVLVGLNSLRLLR